MTDEGWAVVLRHLLPNEDAGSRHHALRAVFDVSRYLVRSGCGWRLLPGKCWGIVAHIRQKGEPPLIGRAHGRSRRSVVERANSWHKRVRTLLIRWKRKAVKYLALVHLACALIADQQARYCDRF